MPWVTTDDVAKAVLTRWEATASLKSIIPTANVMIGRVREATGFPYARLLVDQDGKDERWTGGNYFRRFRVTIEGYTSANPPVSGTLKNALDTAFAGGAGSVTSDVVVPNSVGTIHCKPAGQVKTDVTPERRNNVDVLKVTSAYEILVQGAA